MAITEVVRKEWRNKAIRRNELAETYFIKEDYFHGLKIFVDALNYLHKEDLMYVDDGRIYFTVYGQQKLIEYGLLNEEELSTT